MKNRISDVRDHMFAALERLSDENLTPEQIQVEVQRSKAISDLGKVIVESAKTEVLHAKLVNRHIPEHNKFLNENISEAKQIQRPPAVYSNVGHAQIMERHAGKEGQNDEE